MTNEPGQAERVQQIPSQKEQPIIVNSPGSIPKPLNDEGLWIPHKYALNAQGKEIISSWAWDPNGSINESLSQNEIKLRKLEEEKEKEDPKVYEYRKMKFLSSYELTSYSKNRMQVLEKCRQQNNNKPVFLTREMIDWALNPKEEALEEIMREVKKQRDQELLEKMRKQQEKYGQGGIWHSQPKGDKD